MPSLPVATVAARVAQAFSDTGVSPVVVAPQDTDLDVPESRHEEMCMGSLLRNDREASVAGKGSIPVQQKQKRASGERGWTGSEVSLCWFLMEVR